MPVSTLLAQASSRAPSDFIAPFTGAQQPGVRCVLCDETLVAGCSGDPEREVCEWCLRDYQRQVLDRSPALRHTALPLLEAVLTAGRVINKRHRDVNSYVTTTLDPQEYSEAIKAQNFAAWALYRLGIDVGRRRFLSLDMPDPDCLRVRVRYGHSVERGMMTALAERIAVKDLLTKATTSWDYWPQIVSFAEDWGLAIRLPWSFRYLTQHLVGEALPDLAAVFSGPRSATLEKTTSATITLRLKSLGTPEAHALLFDNPGTATHYHDGCITVSRLRRLITPDGWLAPATELSTHLSALGFECDALPVCGHLGALRPETRVDPGSSSLDLQRALARLGLVDTCQTQRAYLGYSRRYDGVVHVVLESGTDDLLVEYGKSYERIKRSSNRQALAALRKHL